MPRLLEDKATTLLLSASDALSIVGKKAALVAFEKRLPLGLPGVLLDEICRKALSFLGGQGAGWHLLKLKILDLLEFAFQKPPKNKLNNPQTVPPSKAQNCKKNARRKAKPGLSVTHQSDQQIIKDPGG